MTKEEVQWKLGVDSEAVFAGIDRVTNYLKLKKSEEKRMEEDYTAWWTRELDKRAAAEAETQNQANAQIGAGSKPESWQLTEDFFKRRLPSAAEHSRHAMHALGHVAKGAFNDIAHGRDASEAAVSGLEHLGLKLVSTTGLMGAVAAATALVVVGFSKMLADTWMSASSDIAAQRYDFWRKNMREARSMEKQIEAERAAAAEKSAKAQADYMATSNQLSEVIAKNTEKNFKTEAELHDWRMDSMKSELEQAKDALDQIDYLRYSKDPAQAKRVVEAQIRLEQAKQAVIDENARHNEAIAAAQKRRADEAAEKLREELRLQEEKKNILRTIGELVTDPGAGARLRKEAATSATGEQTAFNTQLGIYGRQRADALRGGNSRAAYAIEQEMARIRGLGAHGFAEQIQQQQAESLQQVVTAMTKDGIKLLPTP